MVSVVQRIGQIKQPYGGYINPRQMTMIQMEDGKALGNECIHPATIGMAVDYLTRWRYSGNIEDAFQISLLGAMIANKMDECMVCLNNIKDLSDKSIENACRAVNFDIYYRAGMAPSKESNEIHVDFETCENIRIMVSRGMTFFETYGPITKSGFTFEGGGYTETVCAGDGDFLTGDTLWDFKVSKKPPTSKHTLQLMMYYIMGKHSNQDYFKTINKIGIFNPRLNRVYVLDVGTIDKTIIEQIEKDVICYEPAVRHVRSGMPRQETSLLEDTNLNGRKIHANRPLSSITVISKILKVLWSLLVISITVISKILKVLRFFDKISRK